jgi:hypothetical protein
VYELQDPPLPWVTADRSIFNVAILVVQQPVNSEAMVTWCWLFMSLQDPLLPWVTADRRILNPA